MLLYLALSTSLPRTTSPLLKLLFIVLPPEPYEETDSVCLVHTYSPGGHRGMEHVVVVSKPLLHNQTSRFVLLWFETVGWEKRSRVWS